MEDVEECLVEVEDDLCLVCVAESSVVGKEMMSFALGGSYSGPELGRL